MALDLGLLVLRLALGGLLFAHGAQKLFGWWGGPGLAGTTGMFGSHLRLRPASFWALVGTLSETGGGLLVALGLLTPLGAAAMVAAMLMAVNVHWPRFFAQNGGYGDPFLILLSALGVGFSGPRGYSLGAPVWLAPAGPMTGVV